jgi:glycosyltransferase involved in cell wall biosynthesis
LYIFLSVLTWAIAHGWLFLSVKAARGLARLPWLADFAPLPDSECPRVTILVAARNEAKKVGQAVESWLALDYPHGQLEIVAVNDRSTDDTGKILDELAVRDPRLKAVHLAELPSGWLGKPHALTKAYELSSGEWLVLTDADVYFAPDTLRRTLHLAQAKRWKHAAGLAYMETHGFWEKVIIPYFGLGFALSEQPWESANPKSKKYIGVGAFQMIRRTAYEAVGTHRKLALDVVEDMKLGKLVKQAGIPTGAFLPEQSIRLRYINGLGEFIRNSEKNFFSVVDYSAAKALGVSLQMLLAGVLPFVLLPFVGGLPLIFCLMAITIILVVQGVECHMLGISPLYALTHPVAALLMAYVMVRAMVLVHYRGGIYWRDTFHPLEELRKNMV